MPIPLALRSTDMSQGLITKCSLSFVVHDAQVIPGRVKLVVLVLSIRFLLLGTLVSSSGSATAAAACF